MKCWYRYPDLTNCDRFLTLLRTQPSIRKIYQNIGCTRTNINSALKNHGIIHPYIETVPDNIKKRMRLETTSQTPATSPKHPFLPLS